MDFIIYLPIMPRGNNTITAIIYRLTKRRILELIKAGDKGTDASAIARLVYLSICR